ncbi:ribonuclease-like 3 [Ctenopharyngodon idella]|uniref:ribonuclease-like 3 n=1 Tax=Ctenopharyngodon idella TaxID=7959 RepID=UPI0022326600|nr:ribonuclease-like 3 [Ctenopharyngodon idella]
MEIHHSAVILLLLLSMPFSTQGQPEKIKPGYQKFLNQHFGPDMNEQKCTSEIRNKKITGTDNSCKDVNTFIKANSDNIKAVCGKAGTPQGGNLFKSNQPFPVIICKLKSGERHPKCEYRGVKDTRYIVLGCEEGWPVHYDKDIIDVKKTG